jgi:predicted aldo/keto reductase-like oxidoreductase
MESIILGKTGLRVNRLGFGGIPIQREDEAVAIETVAHAIKSGVNFLDTARAYTTSEGIIGKALALFDHKVYIASKSMSLTQDAMHKDIEISLDNLGTNHIDLYQCHYVKTEDDYLKIISPGGALNALNQAKKEGLIGHIGITSHNLDLLERILDDDIFETIMVCFSFLEPKAKESVIPKALEKNVGVIAMKPFSGGVIDDASLALKYVLSQQGILVIPGVETIELFNQNWTVLKAKHELTEIEKSQIETIRGLFDKNFCRRCDYCQPCTEDIPIQTIMGIRFAIKRFGKRFLEADWVKSGLEKARNCTACGECLSRCPYELPIPNLIKENLDYLDEKILTSKRNGLKK